MSRMLVLIFLFACASTSVGGKRHETTDKDGHRTDSVDSYCIANCASHDPNGGCAKFNTEAADTCEKFLHYNDAQIKEAAKKGQADKTDNTGSSN